jgi:hypothetical protein
MHCFQYCMRVNIATAKTMLSAHAATAAEPEDADDIDGELMDLDEAANDTGEADEKAEEAPEEEFGLNFDFGQKPLAKLLRLSLAERLKWFWGSPLPPSEMAHRIMTTLDTDKKGSLPPSALDFILKQIQGQLPLSKETFDLAEVCSAPPYFSLSMREFVSMIPASENRIRVHCCVCVFTSSADPLCRR